MRFIKPVVLSIALVSGLGLSIAFASSEDAWEAFRTDVAEACRTALELEVDAPIKVSMFGSQHFGFGIAEGEEGPLLCLYDKAEKTTEVEREFMTLPETE